MRLYVPFWISWLMVCLWKIYRTGGIFYQTPSWSLPLTLLGIDGYLATRGPAIGLDNTFYLVGEWFLGALVIITLVWPALRILLRRFAGCAIFGLGVLEVLCYLFSKTPLGSLLSLLSLAGILSFSLGAYSGTMSQKIRGESRVCLAGGGLTIFGLVLSSFTTDSLTHLPYQVVAYGIFLFIEGFPQIKKLERCACDLKNRWGSLLVSLSNLTMYFFMFKHVVAHFFVFNSRAARPETFGNLDYFGLAFISLSGTLLIALLADSVQKKLHSMIAV